MSGFAAARPHVSHPAVCAREAARLGVQPPDPRSAYRAFWLTNAFTRFWGASNHIELLMEQVRAAAPAANLTSPILIECPQCDSHPQPSVLESDWRAARPPRKLSCRIPVATVGEFPWRQCGNPCGDSVGAAPYNTVGGDISHTWTYFRLWGCGASAADARERRGTILGYEPVGGRKKSRLQ